MAADYLSQDTRGPDVPQEAPALNASSTAKRPYHPQGGLLLAGGFAGCVSKTVTAPLARLTILYQVQTTNHVPGWTAGRSLSIGEALARVARTEGVLVRCLCSHGILGRTLSRCQRRNCGQTCSRGVGELRRAAGSSCGYSPTPRPGFFTH